MKVNGIEIDIQVISDTSKQIDRISGELKTNLESITNEMGSLNEIWSSPAQIQLNSNFQKLNKKFDDFYETLKNYGAFLNEVSVQYGYTEKQIKSNADNFM